MGQSKIKTIQPNGSYPNDKAPDGVTYTFEVELEDGESGEVGAQKKDRWKVGDEVEYTLSQNKWGNKLKLSKPGFSPNQSNKSNQPKPFDPEVQKRIDSCWAIGLAIKEESDPEKILEAAEFLLNLRSTLISKL